MRDVKTGSERLDPILSQIERTSVSHDGTTRQVSQPKIVDTPMKLAEVDVTMQLEWLRETDVDAFAAFLWDFCQRFNALEIKHLLENVSITTQAVGNVVDGKEMNFWDAQIEMLKKVELQLDEHGHDNLQMVASPQMIQKMRENPPTAEQTQQWNETMQAKRDEYYAQKRTRRLS